MNLSNSKNSKYEAPFSLKILDENYNLVTPINYESVQWDREFNTVGKFVIDGVVGEYNRDTWKYVYTEKRKNLGVISQVNWKKDANISKITLSGFFEEVELNKMVCYSKPTHFDDDTGVHYGTSILSTDAPTWVTVEDTADNVAIAFFNGFKQISLRNYQVGDFEGTGGIKTNTYALDIELGTVASGDYHYAIHNRNNEQLGHKLYDILKESYASYEVSLDYINKVKRLNIIHGVIRTQTGHDFGVNPVLLSSRNGTIKNASIVTSNTDTKDAVIQYSEEDTQTLILANVMPDSVGRFVAESMSSSQSDFISDTPSVAQDNLHKLSVMADASKILYDKRDVLNIQFDYVNSSYRYMEDFDLGDVISVEIPEIGISVDTQIIACHEVIRGGVWSLSMDVGTTTLRKRGNV